MASESAALPPARRLSVFGRIFAFLASFGLGVVVLTFLLLLTWLGTLDQTHMSLHDVQKKYFDSLWCTYDIGPVKIPLPGVTLLMAILFVNMLCGGILRVRKSWRNIFAVIAHCSMLLLIAAGGVSFLYKKEGHIRLHEGESASTFFSAINRVIEISPAGKPGNVLMIPEGDFADCVAGRTRTFTHASLPFELTVSDYAKNAAAETTEMRPDAGKAVVVDTFYLKSLEPLKEAEANFPGVVATVKNGKSGEQKQTLLWDMAGAPWTYDAGADGKWLIRLTRQTWELPFTVTLNRFTHEFFPGTRTPKVFESDVTKRENGIDQAIKIEMNKPLRRSGYTLFQSSWGPETWTPEQPRSRLYSVFAVVNNPSDQWPKWSLILATVAMACHFLIKLSNSIARRQSRDRPPPIPPSTPAKPSPSVADTLQAA